MKRISLLLALVAVLALAGTAAAGQNIQVGGSATLTLKGDSDNPSPFVSGGPSVGVTSDFSFKDGDNWSYDFHIAWGGAGLMTVDSWKLYIHPGMFKVYGAVGKDLTGYADHLGFVSLGANPGGVHAQIVADPIGPFKVVFDKATSDNNVVQEGTYVEVPAGKIIPGALALIYNAKTKTAVLSTKYTFANGIDLEAAAGMTQDKTEATALGAELTVPVTPALQAYLVAKQAGANFAGDAANETRTLGKFTYTAPSNHYQAVLYLWQSTKHTSPATVSYKRWASLSIVEKPGTSFTWYSDADGTAYRNLTGKAAYLNYDVIARTLGAQFGAPVIAGKAALKIKTDDLLRKDDPATQAKEGPVFDSQLYVKLSDKLNSVLDARYEFGSAGLTTLTNTLNYTVSSSSSVSVKLEKAALGNDNHLGLKYEATFKVSF